MSIRIIKYLNGLNGGRIDPYISLYTHSKNTVDSVSILVSDSLVI